jgi:calcineurin-like phosphoesterase family protein
MIYFTSDLHFGHANIIKYCDRPFDNTDEMAKALIGNWNSVVDHEDTVFVLGDFAMGDREANVPLARHLNGKKILVAGNHDHCWRGLVPKKGQDFVDWWRQFFLDNGFTAVLDHVDLYFGEHDLKLTLNHFPFTGDSYDEDRYKRWRPVDDGQWVIHGHIHDLWRVNGRMINVGCDVWDFTPVPMETILELIER